MEATVQPSDIYKQDLESLRYQDHLMWGRFQTATVVEGALLASLYGASGLEVGEDKPFLVLAGGLVVAAICSLAIKDSLDSSRHLLRIKELERETPLPRAAVPWVPGWLTVVLFSLGACAFNVILYWRHC